MYVRRVIRGVSWTRVLTNGFSQLLTHAALLFANECVGKLAYEATPTAISMAGIFLTFVIEYFSHRLVDRRKPPARVSPASSPVVASEASAKPEAAEEGSASVSAGRQEIAGPDDPWSVTVMEAGIIFHSICTLRDSPVADAGQCVCVRVLTAG